MPVASVTALDLAAPFGDHMVLQRGVEVPVWGTAEAGSVVKVSFGGRDYLTTANASGKWSVRLGAMPANAEGKGLLVKSGGKAVSLKNVLVGDVWLATGQSNMRWDLAKCATGKKAIAESSDAGLRFLNMAGGLHPGSKKYSVEYLKNLTEENYYETVGWQESGPKSAAKMSGVAYFFAQKLRTSLKVPVGVIHCSVGGTPIEAHISPEEFGKVEQFKDLVRTWPTDKNYPRWCQGRAKHNLTHWLADPALKDKVPPHPFAPTFLWKAGPARLAPLPIKGVIWYQGESNAGRDGTPEAVTDGSLNKKKFGMLLNSWRGVWGKDLPCYYVQLPGLNRKWPVFREWQLEASKEFENVGMAVSIDVGHPTNEHPNQKKPVGERLARLALAGTYGKEIVPNGPIYKSVRFSGGKAELSFSNSKGMKSSREGGIVGFEIAGDDKTFFPAVAMVQGEKVIVESSKVKEPKSVRYAWDNDPANSLVNAEGIPASPFRTDRWKEVSPSGNVKRGSAAPLAAVTSKKIRVACVGDSITFGSGIKDRNMTYPAQLQMLLGEKYEVKNFGNPGRGVVLKSMRGKSKRVFYFMKEYKAALGFEPHIVVCNLGINELMDWNKFGKKDFVNDYKMLISDYQSLDTYPRVFVWKDLAPLFKGQRYFGAKEIAEINGAIGMVAQQAKVDTVDMAKPFASRKEAAKMFPDFIHLNAEGAKVIAQEVFKAITEEKLWHTAVAEVKLVYF